MVSLYSLYNNENREEERLKMKMKSLVILVAKVSFFISFLVPEAKSHSLCHLPPFQLFPLSVSLISSHPLIHLKLYAMSLGRLFVLFPSLSLMVGFNMLLDWVV